MNKGIQQEEGKKGFYVTKNREKLSHMLFQALLKLINDV